MPIYEYECKKCGTFEHFQSMSEDPLERCPECRSKVSRLISSSAFHLRGGGWYADGYDSKSAKSKTKSEKSGKADNASAGAKAEPKPAAASKSDGSGSSSSK